MKKIRNSLANLSEEGIKLTDLSKQSALIGASRPIKEEYYRRRTKWMKTCYTVLEFAGMEEYLQHISKLASVDMRAHLDSEDISRIVGILESAIYAIDEGYVGKLRYMLHAEMFDSYLDQALELLRSGHKIPAAVLGRIVLEKWLRDEAEKAGISVGEKDKASTINDGLKKAGIFNIAKWRQIQTFLDIGNLAAHGKESGFEDDNVKQLIEFSKINCV